MRWGCIRKKIKVVFFVTLINKRGNISSNLNARKDIRKKSMYNIKSILARHHFLLVRLVILLLFLSSLLTQLSHHPPMAGCLASILVSRFLLFPSLFD